MGDVQRRGGFVISFSLLALLTLTAGSAEAFTMSDGTTVRCTSARGLPVIEVYEPFPTSDYTGITVSLPDGSARITWNQQKLNSLPREAHDFIFFHECAHAKVPTSDE